MDIKERYSWGNLEYSHHNPILRNSILKYGRENFIVSITEYPNISLEELINIEQGLLDIHYGNGLCVNLSPFATNYHASGENHPCYGKNVYNNGIKNKYFSPGEEIPEGYIIGGLPFEKNNFKLSIEERKKASSKGGKKASKYMSNSKWINNGVINKRVPKDYCINTGWVLGKVKNNKKKLEKELLKQEKCNKRKIERELRIKERKKIILDSGINYSTRGWIKKLSNLLGISISSVRKWTKKYMPEFYDDYNITKKHN